MERRISEIKEYYDTHLAGKLKDFVNGNKRVERAYITMNELIIKQPLQILEIGCGIGHVAWRMSKQWKQSAIMAFDISGQSVQIAKNLFKNSNLSFVQADDVNELKTNRQQFDIIYMMDVYEHINIDERKAMHKFVEAALAPEGMFFISCPTPKYLSWLSTYKPDEIQPVDESISLIEIADIANDIKRNLIYYKEVSVWNLGDYFHAAFANRSGLEKFTDKPLPKKEINSIRVKLTHRLQAKNNHKENELSRAQKILMIQDVAREDIIKKILGKA